MAIDLPKSKYNEWTNRDEYMAISLANLFRSDPKAKVLAILGNLHVFKKLEWQDHVPNKHGAIREYLTGDFPNLNIFSLAQIAKKPTEQCDFFNSLHSPVGAVAADVDKKYQGWRLGMMADIAIKPAGVEARAQDLKENMVKILDETGAEKLNIIAHSMGGLDSRHMLFDDRNAGRIHKRIASLTTISTPHAGSPFADWGVDHMGMVPKFITKLGLDMGALQDLRTDVCKAFNARDDVKAFESSCESDTLFQTYAGRQSFWGTFNLLKGPFRIIEKRGGDNPDEKENDGLVSIESAKWRDRYFKGILEDTDHLNELGWWDFAQLADGESSDELLKRIHRFYADVAKDLP